MVCLSDMLAVARLTMPYIVSFWNLVALVALLVYPDMILLYRYLCISSVDSVKIF